MVVTVAEDLTAAGILVHILGEQQLKERWPNSDSCIRFKEDAGQKSAVY